MHQPSLQRPPCLRRSNLEETDQSMAVTEMGQVQTPVRLLLPEL
jgi:hypothetical protein